MVALRRIRTLRFVLALVVLAAGALTVVSLTGSTGGVVSEANAVCLAPICPPGAPPVKCSNGRWYANRCVANAACQYQCKSIDIEPVE